MRQFAFGLLAVLTANIYSSVLPRVHVVAVRAGKASGSASPSSPSRPEEQKADEDMMQPEEQKADEDMMQPEEQKADEDMMQPEEQKADEDMMRCTICLEENPAKDLVSYFEDCGAGDVCEPGHKFCAECARNAKETSVTGALCPVCRESVANAKQGHTCTVCHNAGGPQEREGRARTPGMGCWACGKKGDGETINQIIRRGPILIRVVEGRVYAYRVVGILNDITDEERAAVARQLTWQWQQRRAAMAELAFLSNLPSRNNISEREAR